MYARKDPAMRFGAFIAPYHRPDGNPTLALERDLKLVETLDQLGYDEAWFGEHHSGGWETIASPELMIAAAAGRTRRIRLGTGVVSLPYHHPLMVADRIVLLDHLTRGRLMFGVGSGSLPADARMLGFDPAERGIRFEEAFDAITDLLACAGPVTRTGRGFALEAATLQLRPFSHPHPPLYVASSFAGAGLATAARRKTGLLLLGLGPEAVNAFLAAEGRLRDSGAVLDRSRVMVVLNVHVGETTAQAVDAIRDLATAEQYEYWSGVVGMPRPDYPPHEHIERMISRGLLVAGSPSTCIDSLRSLLENLGPIGGILIAARDWARPAEMRRSWELFAREVAPALGQAHTAPARVFSGAAGD